MFRYRILSYIALFTVAVGGFAQEEIPPNEAGEADTPAAAESGDVSDSRTISVEGEEAISTNFAPQAILLYGASGNRTLQLNESSSFGELPYYADYVMAPSRAGRYTLWYGGSIPGARDPLSASYGSPIELSIDDGESHRVYWEDVAVGPAYSPPYSWVRTVTLELDPGVHTVRITVPEKRRYDDRFFFYLDRLLLLPEGETPPGVGELRENPESIEDYLIRLKEDPTDLESYERLIFLYTLLGDHLNAIRYANRALSVAGEEAPILRLLARNTIWNGDISGGLNAYWRLLSAAPEDPSGYLEAGKIAAWNGFFGASEQYYQAGIDNVETELPLVANLGFTYLWWARESDARQQFREAERLPTSPGDYLELGKIYELNENRDRAEQVYREGIERFPEVPALYVRLLELLYALDREEEIAAVRSRAPGEAEQAIERLELKQQERRNLIGEYRRVAAENPLDVGRRRVLAQTFFWNDDVDRGVREYETILAVDVSARLVDLASDRGALFEATALAVAVRRRAQQMLRDLGTLYDQLQDSREAYLAAVEDEEEDPAPLLDELAAAISEADALVGSAGRLRRLWERSAADIDDAVDGELEALQQQREAMVPGDEPLDLLETIRAEVQRSQELGFGRGSITAAELNLLQDHLAAPREPFEPEGTLVPEDRYYQLLRQVSGGIGEAGSLLAELPERESAPLRESIDSFLVLTEEEPLPATLTAPTAEGEATRAGEELLGQEEELALLAQDARSRESSLSRRLRLRGEMALIEVEQGRLSFRTQLGNLFSDAGDIRRAINQYERVLTFDPSNLEAKYALANLYRRDGRWAVAKRQLREIYRVDPGYRNSVGLYNDISAANADTLVSRLSTEAESQRSAVRGSLNYTWRINSRVALDTELSLRADRLRYEASGQSRRHAYQVGGVSVAVPLTFLDGSLLLKPEVGASAVANGLYVATPPGELVTSAVDGADYFQYYRMRPELGLGASYTFSALYTAVSYSYGPYQQEFQLPQRTVAVDFEDLRAHSGDFDLAVTPRESRLLFFQRLRADSGGELDYLLTDNGALGSRYLLKQSLQFALLERSSPYSRIALEASGSWEDYVGRESERLYLPTEVFQVGGAVQGAFYRPINDAATYGVRGRLYGGYYQPFLIEGGEEPSVRAQLELGGELSRRNVAFQLNGILNTTSRSIDNRDFYSLQIEFLTVLRNFDVLSR